MQKEQLTQAIDAGLKDKKGAKAFFLKKIWPYIKDLLVDLLLEILTKKKTDEQL